MLIFDDSGDLFNSAAHFMATNPAVKLMEPLLGIGFIVHIFLSFILEYQNWKARPVKYSRRDPRASISWASRNMLILGAMVLVFLVVHLIHFFWVIKFNPGSLGSVVVDGVKMEDTYTLVATLFKNSVVYGVFYVIGGILLGLHLSHGFWSGFHTLGLSNKNWMGRLQFIGKVFAIFVAFGFSVIPLYFLIKF